MSGDGVVSSVSGGGTVIVLYESSSGTQLGLLGRDVWSGTFV